jgi:hypothetical protein
MDHLPLPHGSREPYPKIPCLLPTRVDPLNGEVFFQSPTEWIESIGDRFEVIKQHMMGGLKKGITVSDVETPIQSWLWFGTIEKIFSTVGVSIKLKDWTLTDDSGHTWLSTSLLNRHLWYWAAAESLVSADTRALHCNIINECLTTVSTALQAWLVFEDSVDFLEFGKHGHAYLQDDDNNILLAISLLGETFDLAQAMIYASPGYPAKAWFVTFRQRKLLLGAGWCVSEIARLPVTSVSRASTLLYTGRMGRKILGRSHNHCSARECVHTMIDIATYRPIHASEDCSCAHLRPLTADQRKIDDLLNNNSYPVITCPRSDDFNSGQRLVVHEPEVVGDDSMYVAISHVWSDKLGNLDESALPTCQLTKIQNQVNALYTSLSSDVPFWIDTICVPRETHVRGLAIQKMRDVYRRAQKVLVLDATMQLIDSRTPPEEILVSIELAPWSSRLWTWHESVLAQVLYFQLKDQAIEGDKLLKLYNTEYHLNPTTIGLSDILSDCGGPNANLCKNLLRIMVLSPDRAQHWSRSLEEFQHLRAQPLETGKMRKNTITSQTMAK